MLVLDVKRSERDCGGCGRRDARRARVGVPAALIELERDVNDRLVIQEPAAHDPVAGHEAREVRANVPDRAAVVEVREVGVVAHRRRLICFS